MIRRERHGDVTRLELSHARSRVTGFSVSVFLVRGVLIDCAFPAVGVELESAIDVEHVRGALITHAHEDHAGNVERLARLGIPIGAAPATLHAARATRRLRFYRRWTWGTPSPLRTDIVPFIDDALRLLATPGHSEDHHVVWDAREGTLFSSDLFLGVRVMVAHANERPRRLVQSLREMIALGPQRMFDAHRGAIQGPVGALEAKVSWMEETIGRIDALIDRGVDDRAIQLAVLGREGLSGFFSGGEYSKRNFVVAVRKERLSSEVRGQRSEGPLPRGNW